MIWQLRRRDFITVIAGATAWMSAARGREPRHVAGYPSGSSERDVMGGLPFFYQGLKATGFVEGKNISIEFRGADAHYDRLPLLAAELVGPKHVELLHELLPSANTIALLQ